MGHRQGGRHELHVRRSGIRETTNIGLEYGSRDQHAVYVREHNSSESRHGALGHVLGDNDGLHVFFGTVASRAQLRRRILGAHLDDVVQYAPGFFISISCRSVVGYQQHLLAEL